MKTDNAKLETRITLPFLVENYPLNESFISKLPWLRFCQSMSIMEQWSQLAAREV